MANISHAALDNSRTVYVPSRNTLVCQQILTGCPFHTPQISGEHRDRTQTHGCPHPTPMVCVTHCFVGYKNTWVCILQFSQNLWGRHSRTLCHMFYWRHTQENFTAFPKSLACECQLQHRLLYLALFPCPLAGQKGCVKCETLDWGLHNLCEVSHREGGSPSKFQTVPGIM